MTARPAKKRIDTGGEPVTFPTWNPVVPADMMRPDIRRHEIEGQGRLYRPAGAADERRPALVVVQGLAGPKRYDENTGMRLEGWISRLWFLIRNVSCKGYHIVRDDSAVDRSNHLVLDFLARVGRRAGA
ncbi:MAG: hypothetical protein GVY13_17490 [Alphaproteobacteria bacterium]|jgi:hypothetical protein|nr:hypothetical protein [Alphaproteobacteria bacterium]